MRQTFSVLMKKQDDALARLYGFLCGRALRFQDSSVGVTEDGKHWRVTLVVDSDETRPEKLVRELYRLMDVVDVQDLTSTEHVSRQYALLGVPVRPESRPYVKRLAHAAGARIVHDTPEEMMLEVTGSLDRINAFADNLRTVGPVRMNCTGPVALDGVRPIGEPQTGRWNGRS